MSCAPRPSSFAPGSCGLNLVASAYAPMSNPFVQGTIIPAGDPPLYSSGPSTRVTRVPLVPTANPNAFPSIPTGPVFSLPPAPVSMAAPGSAPGGQMQVYNIPVPTSSAALQPYRQAGPVAANAYAPYGYRQVQADLTTDTGRRTIMDVYAENGGTKWVTNRIKDFIAPDSNYRTDITDDGRIIISGLKLNIPDMASQYKNDLESQLTNLYKAMCHENKISSSDLTIIKWCLGVFLVLFIMIMIGYGIYRFFCNNTSKTP